LASMKLINFSCGFPDDGQCTNYRIVVRSRKSISYHEIN